jgi:hypothetical protein
MIDRSLNGGYAAIAAIFHTDPFAEGEIWAAKEAKWMDGTLEYVASKGVPIWSGEMWLDFVEARHNSRMENIRWIQEENRLNFVINIPELRSNAMSILLPLEYSNTGLSGLEVNGHAIEFVEHTLGAQKYARFEVGAGESTVEAYYK